MSNRIIGMLLVGTGVLTLLALCVCVWITGVFAKCLIGMGLAFVVLVFISIGSAGLSLLNK